LEARQWFLMGSWLRIIIACSITWVVVRISFIYTVIYLTEIEIRNLICLYILCRFWYVSQTKRPYSYGWTSSSRFTDTQNEPLPKVHVWEQILENLLCTAASKVERVWSWILVNPAGKSLVLRILHFELKFYIAFSLDPSLNLSLHLTHNLIGLFYFWF